jgi:RNA polymerase sigma-32 factor
LARANDKQKTTSKRKVAPASPKGTATPKPAAAHSRAASSHEADREHGREARTVHRDPAMSPDAGLQSDVSVQDERDVHDERDGHRGRGRGVAARGEPAPVSEPSEAGEAPEGDDADADGDLPVADFDALTEPEGDGGDVIEATAEVVEDGVEEQDDSGHEGVERLSPRAGPLARVDPLQQYLREVQRHPLLTPQEEHDLAVQYVKTSDVGAAARLVTANLRLVVKLAYEYRRAYKNIMDLIQEGNIGLMQAVKRYDPYRGVKLSSYAAWWIRAYILRFILNNWRLVKLGTTQAQRKLFFNLNKEKARLAAMGIEPSAAEIAGRLGVEEQEVTDMDRRLSSGEMSLDAPVGDTEGRPVSRLEMLPSTGFSPDVAVAEGEIQQMLKQKLADFRETLKGKDVQIFDERLVADEPLTLQELGDRFGISRERVRQLEARLTGRLRDYLKTQLGEAVEVS